MFFFACEYIHNIYYSHINYYVCPTKLVYFFTHAKHKATVDNKNNNIIVVATPQMIEIILEVERWFPLLGVGLTVSIVEERESRRDKELLPRTEDREKCIYEHFD